MSASHAAPTPARPNHVTPAAATSFARRRLRLGITGVGASVGLALAWLAILLTGPPARLDATLVAPLTAFAAGLAWPAPFALVPFAVPLVLAVFAAHALLLLPVELLGGAVVVRTRPGLARWGAAWLRGLLAQALLLALLIALAATATAWGDAHGWPVTGLGGGVLLGSGALLALQGAIARLYAPIRVVRADATLAALAAAQGVDGGAVRLVHAPDEAFVGGWIGLRRPTLWVPAAWTPDTRRELLTVQLARRQVQRASGARRRGLLRAALWPALGVLLGAPLLPVAPDTAHFWLALPAVSTLWMFVGVLVLPSFSRPVVYSADAVATARLGPEPVRRALRQLDAWQDDEAERSPGVEFTFHPVPSRGNRERALDRGIRRTLGGAHQLTRLSLFTSLAGGSLLGRVVHCNVGRPALWAVYPGD